MNISFFTTMRLAFLIGCTALLMITTPVAMAQYGEPSRALDVALTVSPEYPEPNQQITFAVEGIALGLETRRIRWIENGQEVSAGIGETTYTTQTGEVGSQITIEVEIFFPTETVRKRRVVSPGGVDILWEAPRSYVPPFYKGKALPAREAPIRVTAIPRINNFSSSESIRDFVFTWERDFRVIGAGSGYGNSALAFTNLLSDREEPVRVTVANREGTFESQGSKTIELHETEVILYQENDTFGRSVRAIADGISTEGRSIDLIAEPYYFSDPDQLQRNLVFDWRANNRELTGPNQTRLFKRAALQANNAGQIFVGVNVEFPTTIFQSGSDFTEVIFR